MYACSKVLNFTHFSSFPNKKGNDLFLEFLEKKKRIVTDWYQSSRLLGSIDCLERES